MKKSYPWKVQKPREYGPGKKYNANNIIKLLNIINWNEAKLN